MGKLLRRYPLDAHKTTHNQESPMKDETPDFKFFAHQYIKELDDHSKVWRIDQDSTVNVIQGLMEVFYEKMVMPLKSDNSHLRKACEVVVNGYENDGMEDMSFRDRVFYQACKEALGKEK